MVTKEKPACPESYSSWYNDVRLCNLKGHKTICLLESGNTCDYYEELLKEEENGQNNMPNL